MLYFYGPRTLGSQSKVVGKEMIGLRVGFCSSSRKRPSSRARRLLKGAPSLFDIRRFGKPYASRCRLYHYFVGLSSKGT